MIAGALAGSATVLLTNPIWVVNTRMTTRKRSKETSEENLGPGSKATKNPTTLGTLLSLLKDEGPLALFSGVMPALVLVVNPILQYTIFEQLKNGLEKKKRITPTVAFLLGAFGKLFATSITYPYITVKSQMHVAGREGKKESMVATFQRIIRDEGHGGLYKGVSPSSVKSFKYTNSCRHRTKGQPECHDRGILVCIQRCSLSPNYKTPKASLKDVDGYHGLKALDRRCCMIG